jgi:hypothetical protein
MPRVQPVRLARRPRIPRRIQPVHRGPQDRAKVRLHTICTPSAYGLHPVAAWLSGRSPAGQRRVRARGGPFEHEHERPAKRNTARDEGMLGVHRRGRFVLHNRVLESRCDPDRLESRLRQGCNGRRLTGYRDCCRYPRRRHRPRPCATRCRAPRRATAAPAGPTQTAPSLSRHLSSARASRAGAGAIDGDGHLALWRTASAKCTPGCQNACRTRQQVQVDLDEPRRHLQLTPTSPGR